MDSCLSLIILYIMGIGLCVKSGVTVLKDTHFCYLKNSVDTQDKKITRSEIEHCQLKPWSIRY